MRTQRGAIEIMEEAVSLLRTAPLEVTLVYMLGAIPFTLALLFFLSDMTRSPFAAEHLATASLGLAALYIWKNICQARFAARLYQLLSPGSAGSGSLFKTAVMQGSLQPLGLIIMFMLPLPWMIAFFRNAALFAALGTPAPLRTARRQAALWSRQNWGILALAGVAGLLLSANVLTVIAVMPQMARSFLGVEGSFARFSEGLVNVYTLGVALALSWLVIDPLLEAAYVLRCFYGESIATGEDLRAALRKAIAVVALAVVMYVCPASAQTPSARAPSIDATQLDRSVDEVIHRREFAWRMSNQKAQEAAPGWLRSALDMAGRAWNWVVALVRSWLQRAPQPASNPRDGPVTPRTLEILIAVAVFLVIAAAAFWIRRRPAPVQALPVGTTASPAINLADESLTADQLPESSWLQLAEEWLAKGDCRMALRALYLAGLNYLSVRGLVSIRRWKTGFEYRRELERRARANPGVEPVFANNLALFEQGWYGSHAVDRGMVDAFTAGLREMRNRAEQI
ncbi:MAG: hypothetical protein ABSB35_00590 [Bryobacteraceae bacterium]|jgi:hypothetical protein